MLKESLMILLTANLQVTTPVKERNVVINKAAGRYALDKKHLLKLAKIESNFMEKAININKNKTVDYGMFQINSVHWDTTCKEYNIFLLEGNALCAAKIVKKIQTKYKGIDDCWLARYHSNTASIKRKYCERLR